MKTSMQILSTYIDEMQERYIALSKNDKKLQTRVNAILTATTLIKMQINDWGIEKEKEQLKKAFSDGQETPINHPTLPHYSNEEYYNDNYNN